jgi:hypothetical protein
MTYLEVINSVLRRLRETEATTVIDNSYTKLVATYVNDVMKEMRDQWDWNGDIKEIRWTSTAGDAAARLDNDDATSVVTNAVYPTQRSAIVYDTRRRPVVVDVTDATGETQLWEDNVNDIRRDYNLGNFSTSAPSYFGYEWGENKGTLWYNSLLDKNRNYRALFYVPQEDLAVTDNTDAATEIQLPSFPVILGAVFYALNERGEEMGEPGNIAERRYLGAVSAAIENDDRAKQSYLYKYMSNDEVNGLYRDGDIFPEITETNN